MEFARCCDFLQKCGGSNEAGLLQNHQWLAVPGVGRIRPIRVALSQAYRGKPARALATKEGEGDLKASETCAMEALNDIMWAEEAYKMSTAEKEEEVKAIWSSEAQAKELLGQDALTYEAVWRLVQEAGLRGQRTK